VCVCVCVSGGDEDLVYLLCAQKVAFAVCMCVYIYTYISGGNSIHTYQGVIEELVYLLAHKKLLPLTKLEKAKKKISKVSALVNLLYT